MAGNVNANIDTIKKRSFYQSADEIQGIFNQFKDGQLQTNGIADEAVTGNKVKSKTITSGKLVDKTITGSKIADKTITGDKIADKVVTGGEDGHIAQKAITAYNIADKAIGENQIGDDSVTASKIKNDSINLNKLDGSLQSDIMRSPIVYNVSYAELNTSDLKDGTYQFYGGGQAPFDDYGIITQVTYENNTRQQIFIPSHYDNPQSDASIYIRSVANKSSQSNQNWSWVGVEWNALEKDLLVWNFGNVAYSSVDNEYYAKNIYSDFNERLKI